MGVYARVWNTNHILMRVNVNLETVLLALPQHFYRVVHEFEVVLSTIGNPVRSRNQGTMMEMHSRPLVLEGFPSDNISNHVEAPASESGKVHICGTIFEIQRASYETLSAILANLIKNV